MMPASPSSLCVAPRSHSSYVAENSHLQDSVARLISDANFYCYNKAALSSQAGNNKRCMVKIIGNAVPEKESSGCSSFRRLLFSLNTVVFIINSFTPF